MEINWHLYGREKQWGLMFKLYRINLNDERSAQPNVMKNKSVENTNKQIRENRRFPTTKLSYEFPKFHEDCFTKLSR